MNHLVFSAFVDEMEKQAVSPLALIRAGSKLTPIKNVAGKDPGFIDTVFHGIGAAPKRTYHELRRTFTNPIKTFKEGWDDLSNMAESRAGGTRWRPEALEGSKARLLNSIKGKSDYVADFHNSSNRSLLARARRGGWLSNTAKYTGTDKWKKALNTAERALPGWKGVQVPMFGAMGYGELKSKNDPRTGRTRGIGERVARAGSMSVIGGLGMSPHFPVIPMLAIGTASPAVGGAAGRAVDQGAAALRKKRPLSSKLQAAPGAVKQLAAPIPGEVAQRLHAKTPAGQAQRIQDTFRSFSKQAGFTVADFVEE
jgi:hypothetical protein